MHLWRDVVYVKSMKNNTVVNIGVTMVLAMFSFPSRWITRLYSQRVQRVHLKLITVTFIAGVNSDSDFTGNIS